MISENTMRLIISIIGAVGFITIFITFPFRAKHIIKKAGNLVIPMKNKQIILPVLIILFSAAILTIIFFKEMGFLVDLVAILTALLGCAIGTQELALHNKCGVYENGLVGTSHYLPVKEIYGVEEINLSEEEKENRNNNVLHVITDKKGTVPFVCDDEQQAAAVLENLLKICPALQKKD